MKAGWLGGYVEPNTFNRTMWTLQEKILKNNDPEKREYIKTVRGRGYIFKGPVMAKKLKGPEEDDAQTKKAKEHYEWGRRLLDTFTTGDGLQKAIDKFQKAYKEKNDFAEAYAFEALAHIWLSIFSWRAPKDTLPESLRLATKALDLDKTLSVAYAAKAFATLLNELNSINRWKESEELFKKAIELDQRYDKNFEAVYQTYSLWLTGKEQFSEAIAQIERALEIEPTSFISNILKAIIYYESRDYNGCYDLLQEIVSTESDIDAAYYIRVLIDEKKGLPDKAIKEIEEGEKLAEGNVLYQLLRAHLYARWDQEGKAVKLLKELNEESESKQRYISPFHRALPYVHIDANEAIKRLDDAAFKEKDPWVLLLKVEPRVDKLRLNERFKDLLRRLGLDPT
jgi:tetratricopeptide (TPR) repeat protein